MPSTHIMETLRAETTLVMPLEIPLVRLTSSYVIFSLRQTFAMSLGPIPFPFSPTSTF